MAPPHNKMNLLMKKDAETTEAICKDLMDEEELRSDVKATLSRNITLGQAKSAREAAIECLKEGMEEELPKLYEREEVEKSLDDLVDLVRSVPKDKKRQMEGWRPGGSVRSEIFPHVRPVHLAYIKRLEAAKADLLQELKKEKKGAKHDRTPRKHDK